MFFCICMVSLKTSKQIPTLHLLKTRTKIGKWYQHCIADRSCEQDWSYYHRSCYFRDVDSKTFTDAQANCESKQANLVTVNDIHEQEFLKTFMGNAGGWNGLNSQNSTNNTFEWVSGEKVNFTYWRKGHPNTKYHCVHMYEDKNFKWQARACSTKHKSVCEKGLLRLVIGQSKNLHLLRDADVSYSREKLTDIDETEIDITHLKISSQYLCSSGPLDRWLPTFLLCKYRRPKLNLVNNRRL